MNDVQRITLEDTTLTATIKLADGNPGAVFALVALSKDASKHDPDSAFGPLAPLFAMDIMGIYGADIHRLFKHVCGGSTLKVCTLERAVQLGIITEIPVMQAAMGDNEVKFDFDDLLAKVQAQLPAFGRS